jgi:archaellum component FlaC
MSDADNVRYLNESYRKINEQSKSLKSGGGGGTSGGMESRVNRLEERVDKLVDGLGEVKVNLATLNERVSHLPSKDFIVKAVVGTGGVLAALSVFAPKLQTLLGLTH